MFLLAPQWRVNFQSWGVPAAIVVTIGGIHRDGNVQPSSGGGLVAGQVPPPPPQRPVATRSDGRPTEQMQRTR